MPRAAIPPAVVADIKKAIADGKRQQTIADEFSVAQGTVSAIKSGKYGEIPWPNGKTGSFKDAYEGRPGEPSAEPLGGSEWSVDATKYMQWPQDARDGMLQAVNTRRVEIGKDPLPDISLEWEMYLNADPEDDPVAEAERKRLAIAAENLRREAIFREFESLVEERLAVGRDEAINELVSGDVPPAPPIEEKDDKPLDPERYGAMNVEQLLTYKQARAYVQKAITTQRPEFLEAAAIVLYDLPSSMWNDPPVKEAVETIANAILESPAALEAAEAKYQELKETLG